MLLRPSNLRKFQLGTAGAIIFFATATGLAAYLPAIGPSPLRFQPAPAAFAVLLPPLKMTDEAATTSAPAEPAPMSIQNESVATAPEPLGPPAPPNVPAPAPVVKVEAGPVVTPQMLLQFFTPGAAGTNAAPAVLVPTPFQLPQSGSSATYNSK